MNDTDARYLRLLLVGRAFTCGSILLLILAIEALIETPGESSPALMLLLLLLGLTVPYYLVGRRLESLLRSASLAIIAVDTCMLAVGLHLVGGQNAIYGLPLYGILIVMAAVVHSRGASYLVAALGSASFTLMIVATQLGWLSVRQGLIALSLEETFPIASVATTFAMSLAMAIVVSSLSQVKDRALSRSELLERELRELNLDLQERIDTAVDGLRAKNIVLERSFDHLQLYSRAVAHDLRNPLTAAVEFLKLGRGAQSTDRREKFFDISDQNLIRADRMLVGLRDVMRSASSSVGDRPIDVRPVLENLIPEFSDAAATIHLHGELGAVPVHTQKLEHIFRNLIANAIDHNSEVPNLVIDIGKANRNGAAAFYVRDNGRGIPSAVLPTIFLPFKRGLVDDETGLGLGLALVEAIVANANGTAQCESIEGQGATFWITLPVVSTN